MVSIPTIETARLVLRPYRLSDFDTYAAMWAEPAVTHFIGGSPYPRDQAWTRFLRHIGMWHHLGFGNFAIEHKASGAFIGETGFHDMLREVTPSLEGTMEMGWALTGAMHGQGLAEEAAQAAIGWAREHGNGASLRVAAKLGFAEFARTTYGGKPVVLLERARVG
jgi:RimJ/RimL family protein N-acetyltransferase